MILNNKTLALIPLIVFPVAVMAEQVNSNKESSQAVERVGDGTGNYSIDSASVYTYAHGVGKIKITVIDDKTLKVNGTKYLKAFIEAVDIESRKLTINFEGKSKQYPAKLIHVFTMDGKQAPLKKMRPGDAIFMNADLNSGKMSHRQSQAVLAFDDQKSTSSSLKDLDEIAVTRLKDKAVEVNGTKHIEGVVEAIDFATETLTVKINGVSERFPFSYFRIFKITGQRASALDIKEGDSVFMNVNMGFSKAIAQKKSAEKP